MRHSDIIQVDRLFHKAREVINNLRKHLQQSEDANKALRNRPELVTPEKKFVYTMEKGSASLDDSFSTWNTKHFLLYFRIEYKKKYGEEYIIKGKEYRAAVMRLKQFRDVRVELQKNKDFKDFIDVSLKKKFNKNFIACLGSLCSDNVFSYWKINRKSKISTDFSDLIAKIPKSKKSVEQLLRETF